MADGVTFQSSTLASPSSGVVVASDDCGGAGQAQIIKMAISTDGSATPIPADASNGLDVDVTRVQGNVTVVDGGGSITVDGTVAVSSVSGIVTIQGDTYSTKEWHFTAAQTDVKLITVSGSNKIRLAHLLVVASNANSVNVDVRIGFATSTLSAASSSGVDKIVLSHPGLAAGSGISIPIHAIIEGALDDDLIITCTVPTSGSIRVVAYYKTI